MQCIWPRLSKEHYDMTSEMIILFKTEYKKSPEKKDLVFSSNYPYELYIEDKFIDDGGYRCPDKESYIDKWNIYDYVSPEIDNIKITIRLHWMNSKVCSVYHRCLFSDPFFAIPEIDNIDNWTCHIDNGVQFGTKVSSQLPAQNIIHAESSVSEVYLELVDRSGWNIISLPIYRSKYIHVEAELINKRKLPKQKDVDLKISDVKNVHAFVVNTRPYDMECKTYDLGYIGLHRFEVLNNSENKYVILCYSEVPDFTKAWDTPNRRKVQMADMFVGGNIVATSQFGQRGCRFLHVITSDSDPKITVYRREYPLDYKPIEIKDSQLSVIYQAIKNNLRAVVDGGIVDTCWRERAQWTGDSRMCIMALKALTNNMEVADHVLSQIASSYNPKIGMVSGIWPVRTTSFHHPMPTFHLAFCLSVIESETKNELALDVVRKSVDFWKKNYVRKDGILDKLAGWNFVDWCFDDEDVIGKEGILNKPNLMCHVWWQQLCDSFGVASGIDIIKFNELFKTESGYRLIAKEEVVVSAKKIEQKSGKSKAKPSKTVKKTKSVIMNDTNLHATIGILCSPSLIPNYKHKTVCYNYVQKYIDNEDIYTKVSPYFAYFVAEAIMKQSDDKMKAQPFIKSYYYDMAKTYGTIQERVIDDCSLAHGWSVAIAKLLM